MAQEFREYRLRNTKKTSVTIRGTYKDKDGNDVPPPTSFVVRGQGPYARKEYKPYRWGGTLRKRIRIGSDEDLFLQAYMHYAGEGKGHFYVHDPEKEARGKMAATAIRKKAEKALAKIASYDIDKGELKISNRPLFDAISKKYNQAPSISDSIRFNHLEQKAVNDPESFLGFATNAGDTITEFRIQEYLEAGVLRVSGHKGDEPSGMYYYFMADGPATSFENQERIAVKKTLKDKLVSTKKEDLELQEKLNQRLEMNRMGQ